MHRIMQELFASAPLFAIFSVRLRSSKIVLNLNTMLLPNPRCPSNTSKQAIYALQSEQSPTRTKVMTILVLIMIFEVTHIHPYENEIFETKELLTNIKIASKLQESTAIRHFDALPIHQNEQSMLYRAKKVPLEPKL